MKFKFHHKLTYRYNTIISTLEEEPKEGKIEIFSTDDEKIKSVGELLTNDSSRAILQLLFTNELTATKIAEKTGISLQLVKYHINKMQDLNIAKISKVEKNKKNQDMNYYAATKFAIVIMPSTVSERAKESKQLVRSFQTIFRLFGFGVAAVASWFIAGMQQLEDVPMRGGMEETTSIEPFQIILPVAIFGAGLIIEVALRARRKKK